jgi:hypothetical protein
MFIKQNIQQFTFQEASIFARLICDVAKIKLSEQEEEVHIEHLECFDAETGDIDMYSFYFDIKGCFIATTSF